MVAFILAVYAAIGFGLSIFACVACLVLGTVTLGWAIGHAAIVLHRYWRFV